MPYTTQQKNPHSPLSPLRLVWIWFSILLFYPWFAFFALLVKNNYFTFSHPDYTVGFGIAPNHAYKHRLADFTAGWELPPTPKVTYLVLHMLL